MRSIKREARGISPVVATILLIAVTAVAGGVIAAYVLGLYVTTTPLIAADVNGLLYDYDGSAAVDNYQNAVAGITVEIKSGRLRNIGDPTYGGTSITITNPTTGFSASDSLPDNTGLWGSKITMVNIVPISQWRGLTNYAGDTLADENAAVRMEVTMTPNAKGRIESGGSISISLQPFTIADARDSDNALYRVSGMSMWDQAQSINVVIAGRDSVTLSGYSGAYMGGVSWTA